MTRIIYNGTVVLTTEWDNQISNGMEDNYGTTFYC